MIESTAAMLWAGGVVWLLVRAVQQYRAYVNLEPVPRPLHAPHVAVVVPARNERDTIADCINGLVGQDYSSDRLTVFIVDDHSSDGTAAIVRDLARHTSVRLIAAGSLPVGWTGKSWACWVGATAAAATDAEWLCFIDADVKPYPALIASAVAAARSRGLEMLSLAPAQRLTGAAQAFVVPAAFLMLAVTQDLRRINDSAAPDATANGQFILIRRPIYERLGGHAAHADEIAEDKALARRVKAAGLPLALYGGERLCECRMYRSSGAWWYGLARNAADVLDGTTALEVAAVGAAAAFAAPLLPIWLFVAAEGAQGWRWFAFIVALAASATLLVTHVRMARYFHVSALYGFCFPAGYLLGAAILVHSAYLRASGKLDWKGRTYIRGMPPDTRATAYSSADRPDRASD